MSCIAILVNYHSSSLIFEAVASLLGDSACDEIHVVDNSVSNVEADCLLAHLPPSVHLTIAKENLGFAGACNLIFASTQSDYVLLLNPDARLFPGALQKMLALAASSTTIGAVGPRVYWDEQKSFPLPPTTFPSSSGQILEQLSRLFPRLLQLRSLWFRYGSIKQWRAQRAFRVGALSGGHVLLSRPAAIAAGGLFDPAFFMYWEDTDLMRRLRTAGFALYLEPGASCLHRYEHSPEKDLLIAGGWPAYAKKYFSGRFWRVANRFFNFLETSEGVQRNWPVIELRQADIHFSLPKELHSAWLIEFSPSPAFIPAMGRLGSGELAEIPACCVTNFRGMDFFIRVSDPGRINSPMLHWIARPG